MEKKINQVKFILMNMGLNEYQASTLSNLLFLGETKATILSKASGVPNARIYGVLNDLSQRGLILKRPGRPALYTPLSPEEISNSLVLSVREKILEKLSIVDSDKEDFENIAEEIYLKAGKVEHRKSLIRIVSVGAASLEETRRIYRLTKNSLLISTRAMEYLDMVVDELKKVIDRRIHVKILMRHPNSLTLIDKRKQEESINSLKFFVSDNLEIRFSNRVEVRGCISDPKGNGEALFLVKEEGVPFSLREAALTNHQGLVHALGSMFDLKWRFDSDPFP
jgi:sugar-specific transcriptional regulator TrmB